MTDIKPIETRYAGCRFRSRLEARWAVLFDHIGIEWQYEPQGYIIGPYPTEVTSNGATLRDTPYLPDFWLPGQGLWVEVKGSLNDDELSLLVNATIPHWGLPASPHGGQVADLSRVGERMLILGSIPRPVPGSIPTHSVLAFWKGDVFRRPAWLSDDGCFMVEHDDELVGSDSGDVQWPTGRWGSLTEGKAIAEGRPVPAQRKALAAYTAARQARFEHGESGFTPPKRKTPKRRMPGYLNGMLSAIERYCDLDTVDGRVRALRESTPVIAAIDDGEQRRIWIEEAAGRFRLPVDAVARSVENWRNR